MKKSTGIKIFITAALVIVVALVVSYGVSYLNNQLSNKVRQRLFEQVRGIKEVTVTYDSIDVSVFRSSVTVTGLRYCSNAKNRLEEEEQGFIVESAETKFHFPMLLYYMIRKNIHIGSVEINDISTIVHFKKKREEDKSPDQMDISKNLLKFIAAINVNKVDVNNASLKLKSLSTSLYAEFDSLYVSVQNLGYDLENDSIFYNDSIYSLSLKHIKFIQPDARYILRVDEVSSKNTENITIKGIKHMCTLNKATLTDVLGKKPATWTDLHIKEVKTSRINIVRSIVNESIKLDSITVRGGYADIYQDLTYPHTTVQRPIQSLLAKVTLPLDLKLITVSLDRFHYTFTAGIFPPSTLNMNSMDVKIKHLGNIDTRDVVIDLKCNVDGGGGRMSATMNLVKDKESTWNEHILVENGDFKAYNGFLGKLAGAQVSGELNRLEVKASGDTMNAYGTFVMEYKDLDAKIIKGTSPIKQLNKASKLVNGAIKIVVPHSNPERAGQNPKTYNVSGERNLYKPYVVYMLTPMFRGFEVTLLAPFFRKDEVKGTYEERKAERESMREARRDEKAVKREARKEEHAAKRAARKEERAAKREARRSRKDVTE